MSNRMTATHLHQWPEPKKRTDQAAAPRFSDVEMITVKIALDPYMHRHLSLEELPRKVAELGYEWIELSPRDDFLAWWVHPRAYPERIASFKKALKDHGVKIASLLPMYRWASPHEDERQTAVRYWKKAIEIAVEMGVDTMNSEFGRGPSPDRGHSANCCGGQFTHEIERGRVVALDGGARPGVREGGDPAQRRAASGGLVRDASPGGRHDPDAQLEGGQVPLLRAAHLLFRRRHSRR